MRINCQLEDTQNHHALQTFNVKARIKIPTYDEAVNAAKLDNRLDQLEAYFTIYRYIAVQKIAFASVKYSSHALT